MPFADCHCHNHARSYFWLKADENRHRKHDRYHPWTIIASNMETREKAGSIVAHGQADLVIQWNGQSRLSLNALYPVEKGFFRTAPTATPGHNQFFRELIRELTSHKLPLRDYLQMYQMRVPKEMIDFYQSDQYDYWEGLLDEYAFAIGKNGMKTRNEIHFPGLLRQIFESKIRRRDRFPNILDAEGTYRIPRSRAELQQFLDEGVITWILTIEGAHSFTGSLKIDEWLRRVDFVKKNWQYPIFFVTFAHHFYNKLCGHAHSFPNVGEWLLNQTEGRRNGFNDDGWKMIRKMLSLTENNEPLAGERYRMLIDVKHMNSWSREQYYDKIVNPCFTKGDIIPVIASHCGYSGIQTLKQQQQREKDEGDDVFDPDSNSYNSWNINMTADDVRIIHKTGGVFGLSFDQRIMGVPVNKKNPERTRRNSIFAIWNSIEGIVKVIYAEAALTDAEKQRAWKIITLGTDFEGFIDAIDPYPTALEFSVFRNDLIKHMQTVKQSKNPVYFSHVNSPAQFNQVADDLCFNNLKSFVLKNFPQ